MNLNPVLLLGLLIGLVIGNVCPWWINVPLILVLGYIAVKGHVFIKDEIPTPSTPQQPPQRGLKVPKRIHDPKRK